MQALLAVYNWRTRHGPLPALRALRGVSVRPLRQAARCRPTSPAGRQINLAGTIPGWTRFPPAQEMLDKIAARPQVRSGPGEGAGGARGAQDRGRAGALVPSVPGVEQATVASASVMIESSPSSRLVRSECLDLNRTRESMILSVPYHFEFARTLAARYGELRNRATGSRSTGPLAGRPRNVVLRAERNWGGGRSWQSQGVGQG